METIIDILCDIRRLFSFMVGVAKRILACFAWVMFSMLLWAIPCNLLYFGIDYCDSHGIPIPSLVDIVLNLVPTAGMLTILPLTVVPAMRGKLPGTASRGQSTQAVQVEMEPSPEAKQECVVLACPAGVRTDYQWKTRSASPSR